MKRAIRIAAAVASSGILAACSSPLAWTPGTSPSPRSAHAVPVTAVPGSLNGVYEPDLPGSYRDTAVFVSATGTAPKIVAYYSAWYERFQAGLAATARAHGAYVVVQLQPSVSLERIATGDYDAYLRSYADAVVSFAHPVILSFGHEMNGTWYSWGEGRTSPAVFIAAWRHVVDVFRGQGANNVTWLWTVNAVNAASAPLRQWWPGSSYVNWTGIDGYFYYPSDTFGWVFGRTLAELRTFTSAPVLISETAVGPGPAAASQVRGLFAGVRADRLLGVVWFDKSQHEPPYHLAWRLESDPAALAAFRAAVGQAPAPAAALPTTAR